MTTDRIAAACLLVFFSGACLFLIIMTLSTTTANLEANTVQSETGELKEHGGTIYGEFVYYECTDRQIKKTGLQNRGAVCPTNNTCTWAYDGVCDDVKMDDKGVCAEGTDCEDCGTCNWYRCVANVELPKPGRPTPIPTPIPTPSPTNAFVGCPPDCTTPAPTKRTTPAPTNRTTPAPTSWRWVTPTPAPTSSFLDKTPYLITSDTCPSGSVIMNTEECESAATFLNLNHTTITETSYGEDRPLGCTYWPSGPASQDGLLYMQTAGDFACSSQINCICRSAAGVRRDGIIGFLAGLLYVCVMCGPPFICVGCIRLICGEKAFSKK